MSRWAHAICQLCWIKEHGATEPTKIIDTDVEPTNFMRSG